MVRGSAPPIWENSLESDKLRAVPSAQTEKEPQAALFLCAETLIGVWKYACKVFRAICIRIRSPRQGWDIAAQKRTVGDAGLYRKAGLLYISLPHLPIFSLQYLVNLLHFASVS